MNSDELADHIVDHFNSFFYGTDAEEDPVIEFQPVNPAEIPEVFVERDDFVVFIFPDSESESAFDRGDGVEERLTVAVLVEGPIRGNTTRALALQFVKQLRRALRNTEFEGYRWIETDVDPLFDAAALKTKQQFMGAFRATFYGID